MKKILLVIAIFVVVNSDAQNRNTPTSYCVNPNGKIGHCQSLDECDTIVEIFNKPNLTERDREFLKASVCISNHVQYLVCCTDDKGFTSELGTRISVTSLTSTTSTASPALVSEYPFLTTQGLLEITNDTVTCLNPNNGRGICTSFANCKPILIMLSSPYSSDSERFLRESECRGKEQGIQYYCCTENSFLISNTTPTSISTSTATTVTETTTKTTYFLAEHVPLFMPSKGVGTDIPHQKCGSHPIIERNLNGGEADTGEFPWMVLVEYRKDGERKLGCTGSIINQRYILTAANCFTPLVLRDFGTPTLIRLGEHDTSSRIDCIENTCKSDILEIGIEKITSHEDYNPHSTSKHNDIALIRLNQNISTGHPFIEPICLPSSVGYGISLRETNLIVAGWGETLTGRLSSVKLKSPVPLISNQDCSKIYAMFKITITDSQVCAGGNYMQDRGPEDSGAPLMAYTGTNWVLEGIASFGSASVVDGYPSIFTRVHSFENWIKRNLEP